MTARTRHRGCFAVLLCGLALAAAGCGGDQDTVAPASHSEHEIANLFWVMLGACSAGFLIVVFLLWLGWQRRNRPGLPGSVGDAGAMKWLIGLGVALPIALMTALFVWSDLFVINSTAAPAKGSTALTVRVIGHEWWWEVRYPGTSVVTANEIHIPVRTRVAVETSTDDVIHSFWVPELNRKLDMIPGHTGELLLDAKRTGVYRGQCSEFCGLQHAHMAVEVIAQPEAAFRKWLAAQEKSAQPSTSSGAKSFASAGCGNCHTIRGTSSHGDVGPDLTHLETRSTLAALTLPNTPKELAHWIRQPQEVKPGAHMPDLRLPDAEWNSIAAYLRTLH